MKKDEGRWEWVFFFCLTPNNICIRVNQDERDDEEEDDEDYLNIKILYPILFIYLNSNWMLTRRHPIHPHQHNLQQLLQLHDWLLLFLQHSLLPSCYASG